MSCNHELCGNIQKVWLPYEVRGHLKGLKSYPYCLQCGMVKNISSDRARPFGYYMNILPHLGITKVQTRLTAKKYSSLSESAIIAAL